MMRMTFPAWPVWGPHFPEGDVREIKTVRYFDQRNTEQELDGDFYRLAIGRNGVSSFVLLYKPNLPKTAKRSDAVTVEYEV